MSYKISKLGFLCLFVISTILLSLTIFNPSLINLYRSEKYDPDNVFVKKSFENFKTEEEYLQFFITIYVRFPGDKNKDKTFMGRDVGHSFVRLTKANPNTLRKEELTFGFYPDFTFYPLLNENGPSKIISNENNKWDTRHRAQISLQNFNKALDFAANVSSKKRYDLSEYNCADFVIEVATNAGILVPETHTYWPFGRGSNPAQLGRDIEIMNGGGQIN